MTDLLDQSVQDVYSGKMSPDQAADQMWQTWNKEQLKNEEG